MIRSSRLTEAKNEFGSQQQNLQQQGLPQPTPADPIIVKENATFQKNITAPYGVFQGDILTDFLRLGDGGVTIKGAYEKSQFGNKYLQLKTEGGNDYYIQVFNQPQPNQPTPIPSSTPPATQNATPTPAATQNATPTPAHTPYPPGTPAATQNPTPSPAATQNPTPTPGPTRTPTPTPGPTSTPIPTRTPTGSPGPTNTVTASRTPTPSVTASRTPTPTPTPSRTPSSTPAPTNIPPTRTPTPTATLNQTNLLVATYTQSSIYSSNKAATFAAMTNNNAFETEQTGTWTGASLTPQSLQWIQADLGGIKQVKTIVLGYPTTSLAGGWNSGHLAGKDLQTSSDGVAWATLTTIPNQSSSPFYTYTASSPINCRYIRVITKALTDYLGLTEFQIYKP